MEIRFAFREKAQRLLDRFAKVSGLGYLSSNGDSRMEIRFAFREKAQRFNDLTIFEYIRVSVVHSLLPIVFEQ